MEIIIKIDGWELQNDDDGFRWVNPDLGFNGASSHYDDLESCLSDFDDMLEQRGFKVVVDVCGVKECKPIKDGVERNTYKVKFIEEICHTYEVTAVCDEVARDLAENEYYDRDDEVMGTGTVRFIGKEPEANELISCEVVDE